VHLTGRVPRQIDPGGAAAANVTAITKEVLTRLASLEAAAA
jgi:chromosome partitioning protein